MNYVGRLISNFKGFYNEINSATLTGAIDVICVQQEDGTFTSSPFHVRFGKMGVLRSREKVIDITVNGEPVDLRMKLGEAGEAFFVQETEEMDEDVPAHLATSPIPSTIELMESGLRDLKREASEASEKNRNRKDSEYSTTSTEYLMQGDTLRTDSDALIQHEINLFTNTENELLESLQAETTYNIETELHWSDRVTLFDANEILSLAEDAACQSEQVNSSLFKVVEATNFETQASGINLAEIGIQTELTGMEVETKASKAKASKNYSPPRNGILSTLEDEEGLDETDRVTAMARKTGSVPVRRKRSIHKRKKKNNIETVQKNLQVDSCESGSSNEGFPDDVQFDMEISDEDGNMQVLSMGRTVSMPMFPKRVATEEWAHSHNPGSSAFHPFSDGDITPIVSPVGSRPASPKSDTEFETQKAEATSQTHLTGDDFEDIDDVKWVWGELPSSSNVHEDLKSQIISSKDGEKTSVGLFKFMRDTKKIRHKPEEKGIYLEDLNLQEMDPEVAALYLYHPRNASHHMRSISDEDTESGRGASLPHSPVSIDSDTHRHECVAPIARKADFPSDIDIAMSLCGGLTDNGEISREKFNQFTITFDELCENPTIMSNPDVVVRLDGKYYNWKTAGPMVMSVLCFQRQLSDAAVETLAKKNMPKKEPKQQRRGWFTWGRGTVDAQNHSAVDKPDSENQIVSADSTVAAMVAKEEKLMMDTLSSDIDMDPELDPAALRIAREGKTSVAGTQTYDKFKKSLQLTSEQLKNLNLKPGVNEIEYSVTTQYQGTSRCTASIFLWKYNDKVIVSDIDGTITKSDVLGQILPVIGKDWSQAGIAKLYDMISKSGYKFLYLSARAIGQSKITRDYIRNIRQGSLKLPEGPLLLSPSSLISAFHKEVIERKPEEFKIGCLKNIQDQFPNNRNPLVAGYGNKINDVWAYRAVGIPISRIFTVNHRGELKMDHNPTFQSSYNKLSDVVDHFFPPLEEAKVPTGNFPVPHEFSNFTYWRDPIPEIEIDLDLEKKSEDKK